MEQQFVETKITACSDTDSLLAALARLSNEVEAPDFRSPWVFRGHGDAEWELKPAAWRVDGQRVLKPLLEWVQPRVSAVAPSVANYWKANAPEYQQLILALATQVVAEVMAVRQFCDLADELGLMIPDADRVPSVDTAIAMVIRDNSDFQGRGGRSLFVNTPFAFAQHHGVPTRYLDWTRDPLIAAFFAADVARRMPSSERQSDELCIWATRCEGKRHAGIEWIAVPRGQHHYLHAQSGLFSLNSGANSFFQEGRRRLWPTFQDGCIQYYGKTQVKRLEKFTLPARESEQLCKHLFGRRVSRAHLMPTLDSVAISASQRWDWLKPPPVA